MSSIGYARVSTGDQDCALQVEALLAAGCSVVRSETRSGRGVEDRRELATVLEFLREGDELVVTRLDRLARSVEDLARIVRRLRETGASLRVLEQNVDTSTAAGTAFFQMLGVFAEFETNLRHERQREGIARAKARGVYKGRRPSIDPEAVRRLQEKGLGASAIARALGIARSSVYRLLVASERDPAASVDPARSARGGDARFVSSSNGPTTKD